MRDKISSWVRQARHRAKRHGCHNDLRLADVVAVLTAYQERCAYCGAEAACMDHAFPLADKAPNVAANTLPACAACKELKKHTDLVALSNSGHIDQARFLELVAAMLQRPGGAQLREHIKTVTGLGF